MRSIGVQRRVTPFVIALGLLLQLSPALATGQRGAHQATIQGSRFPGMPVPSKEAARDKHLGPVDVTFTKWRTAGVPLPPAVATRSLFAGHVGGDLGKGDFVGEVLDPKLSTPCTTFTAPPCPPGTTPPTISQSINVIQAIYEVRVGEDSFIALLQGGSTSAGGRLEGVVVSGRRIGAHVRVAFDRLTSCTDRDGVAHGPCFDGTIHVERAPKE